VRAIRIIESVGNTPLLELSRISEEVAPVRILGKAEWYNPGGSVKDRPALNMVLDGERTGRLTKDKVLLDATSGNTGIAYAMIGAAMGYRIKLTVPKNIGLIRQRILEAYGAELVLTDPTLGTDGAIEEAIRIYEAEPDAYFYSDQYGNDANWQAHYNGTGPEIWSQTGGEATHFVAGLGTTGTFRGNGTFLKEKNEKIKLISFQPNSPMHGLEGMKHLPTALVPAIYREDLVDENIWIQTEDAQAMVRRLAREEGILVGPSAGAAVTAALQVARGLTSGTVVTVLPDSGHKYLDFQFWDETD
jgi:cysteine synthase B